MLVRVLILFYIKSVFARPSATADLDIDNNILAADEAK